MTAGPLLLVALLLALQPAQAHPRGLYATKQDAEKRAQELKCAGVFQMDDGWMPCANERAFHRALLKAQ